MHIRIFIKQYFLLLLGIGVMTSCTNNSNKKTLATTASQPTKNTIRVIDSSINVNDTASVNDTLEGDFNGDGKKEFVRLIKPVINEEKMECIGDCNSVLKFSDSTISAITVKQCIGGSPVNLGDLNNNGSDEIGLLPEWFTSCWSAYYVYTYKKDKWIYAVEPFSTHCNQWDYGIVPIEKDPAKKGNVLIRYSKLTDEGIVTKTKSVPVK